jgi:membrane protein CcdC involved in cytochrome C biogenesis
MASRQYIYNTTDAANFAAFAPISLCLFVAWIIFVSHIGQAGMYGNLGGTGWWLWSCMILYTLVTYHFAFLKLWAAAHILMQNLCSWFIMNQGGANRTKR